MREWRFIFLVIVVCASVLRADPTEDLFAGLLERNQEKIDAALMAHANVNAVDKNGNAPLHICAAQGDGVLIEILLKYGASINAKNAMKQTPLHVALIHHNFMEVEILMRFRADPRIRDHRGRNAIEFAEDLQDWRMLELLNNAPVLGVGSGCKECGETKSGLSLPKILIPAAAIVVGGLGLAAFFKSGEN